MKKIYLVLLFVISVGSITAQQEVQWTQYMYNKLYFNPGYAGMSDGTCVTGFFRSQWAGFENAPSTSNFNMNIPVSFLGGGLGLNVVNDQLGVMNDVMLGFAYSYHIDIGKGTLGLGLRGDLMNRSTVGNPNYIAPDGTSGEGDAAIVQGGSDGINFDMAFGAYYQSRAFWLSLSSVRLLETTTEFSAGQGQIQEMNNRRHYFLAGGYNFNIPNTNIILQPNIMVKSDITQTSFDAGLMATIANRFWAGTAYRLEESFSFMGGFYLTPSLRFGYAYDAGAGPLRTESTGSHEIFVSYCFKIDIPPREPGMYRHPLFL